jgi:hypothetical protein
LLIREPLQAVAKPVQSDSLNFSFAGLGRCVRARALSGRAVRITS